MAEWDAAADDPDEIDDINPHRHRTQEEIDELMHRDDVKMPGLFESPIPESPMVVERPVVMAQ